MQVAKNFLIQSLGYTSDDFQVANLEAAIAQGTQDLCSIMLGK